MWVKIVDADAPACTNPAALVFLTMTTRPTFRVEFKRATAARPPSI